MSSQSKLTATAACRGADFVHILSTFLELELHSWSWTCDKRFGQTSTIWRIGDGLTEGLPLGPHLQILIINKSRWQSTNTQIQKYTNTQIHKYTNTEIQKYTKRTCHWALTYKSWSSTNPGDNPQIHKYTNTQIHEFIHKYTNTDRNTESLPLGLTYKSWSSTNPDDNPQIQYLKYKIRVQQNKIWTKDIPTRQAIWQRQIQLWIQIYVNVLKVSDKLVQYFLEHVLISYRCQPIDSAFTRQAWTLQRCQANEKRPRQLVVLKITRFTLGKIQTQNTNTKCKNTRCQTNEERPRQLFILKITRFTLGFQNYNSKYNNKIQTENKIQNTKYKIQNTKYKIQNRRPTHLSCKYKTQTKYKIGDWHECTNTYIRNSF